MNSDMLLNFIGTIDSKYISEAAPMLEQERPAKRSRLFNTTAKKALLALAAAFLLLLTMIFSVSALREPVVQFLAEVYEKYFHSGDEPEWMYEQETTRYLQEGETAPTTAAWHGSGRADKRAGFPGYTWSQVPFSALEIRTEYAQYAPGVKEVRLTITNHTGKELIVSQNGGDTATLSWGAGGDALQYWDGYGWYLCPVPPNWNFTPHPEYETTSERLPPGETQAVFLLEDWDPPVEGFYRITIRAREFGEQYQEGVTEFRMQAVFEISSSSKPKLTQELAAKLIPIQTKIITDEPYYPPTPIVRPTEPIVKEPIPPIEETPFSPRDVVEMQQGFWEVRDYVARIPAKRYKYWMADDAIFVYFFQHAQGEDEAFLCLRILGWVENYVRGGTAILDELPEDFLIRAADIEYIQFSAAGGGVPLPRGIQIGDPESRISECYPAYDSLEDSEDVFISGSKNESGNWVFLYATEHANSDDQPEWVNPLRLEYWIEGGKVAGIYFSRSFEQN